MSFLSPTLMTQAVSRNPSTGIDSAVQFKGRAIDRGVEFIVSNFYDKGEGVRYVVEQTLGYTVPRTVQQYNRTRHITGEGNKLAAKEMFVRDIAADFTDTFLPGILATHIIGRTMDASGGTLLRHNLDYDALDFYKTLTRNGGGQPASRAHFIKGLEESIRHFASETVKNPPKEPIRLEQSLIQARQHGDMTRAAVNLAKKLGLSSLDVTLKNKGKIWSGTLTDLLSDTQHLVNQPSAQAYEAAWGKQLATAIQKTSAGKKYQMIGNVAALLGSISIPFIIRRMTKRHYGEDAFPGSKEIEDFFHGDQRKLDRLHAARPKNDFHWFPYLKKTLKESNLLPTALTVGFFTVLGATVLRRFKISKLNPTKLKDWFKIYQFERGFPNTTITQMELTFGLLCGMRLAASRNDSEFRETFIRDCALGWPTLTYFFKILRENILAPHFNKALTKKFKNPYLLFKADGSFRSRNELTHTLVKNIGVSASRIKAATAEARLVNARMTLACAAISIAMLAWFEPLIGIWMTNNFELNKVKKKLGSQA